MPHAKGKFHYLRLKDQELWQEVMELGDFTHVKIEGYTSENNYSQPFILWFEKAYDNQPARMCQLAYPEAHAHSAAVEWMIEGSGIVKIRKTKYDTNRDLWIKNIDVFKGNVKMKTTPVEFENGYPKS